MTTLSLRDAAYALDVPPTGVWSVRTLLSDHVYPEFASSPLSLSQLTERFAAAGAALRSFAGGTGNLWTHLDRKTIVDEIRDRLRDPMILSQSPTGLCGPFAVLVEFIRRDPVRYIEKARELLETGLMTCPTGRVIVAEAELREEPKVAGSIGQVDWLLAATMRDDENIWEDVDDDANGLESMTFWGEQRDWIQDVLDFSGGEWKTCFSGGEISCMKKAEQAVKSGGVAFFLVDANIIKDGGSDREEEMWFRFSSHFRRAAPTAFQTMAEHSKDDDFPPDHWVMYLGGLNLGSNPEGKDPVNIALWSWGRTYKLTGTVDAFTEYLYAVCTGY